MLKSIQIYNSRGVLELTLPVGDVEAGNPYIVKNITGLGPVVATVNTIGYANADGSEYTGSNVGSRNITFQIGYRPSYYPIDTASSLRSDLYRSIRPRASVTLRFIDDERESVEIDAYVESHEPTIFTSDPEVNISMICPKPYFRALRQMVIDTYTNTDIYPLYRGDTTAGLYIDFEATSNNTNVALVSNMKGSVKWNGVVVAGEVFALSTVPGDKYIRIREGTTTRSVLDGLVGNDLSLGVHHENEIFRVETTHNIPCRLIYTTLYSGL